MVLREKSGVKENKDGDDDARRFMEWPPSPWTWQEFSSRTAGWEKKVFAREGEAAGTVGDLLIVEPDGAMPPTGREKSTYIGMENMF
nr:unnamed protein product [Digitaria exilis]